MSSLCSEKPCMILFPCQAQPPEMLDLALLTSTGHRWCRIALGYFKLIVCDMWHVTCDIELCNNEDVSHSSTEQALPDDWEYTGTDVTQIHSTAHNDIGQGNDWREYYVSSMINFQTMSLLLMSPCFLLAIIVALIKLRYLNFVMQNIQSRTHQIGACLFDLSGSNRVRGTTWTWIFRCVCDIYAVWQLM